MHLIIKQCRSNLIIKQCRSNLYNHSAFEGSKKNITICLTLKIHSVTKKSMNPERNELQSRNSACM